MKKILIVDDEKRIRRIYSSLLAGENFLVTEAQNAVDANEHLKKSEVDLMLLDIRMPGVRGDVLATLVKTFHTRCRIIVSSVYPVDEQRRLIPDADGYHDKSQGIDTLLAKINEVLSGEALVEKVS